MNIAQTKFTPNHLCFQGHKVHNTQTQTKLSFKGSKELGADELVKEMEMEIKRKTQMTMIKLGLETHLRMHVDESNMIFDWGAEQVKRYNLAQNIPNTLHGIASTFENSTIPGFKELAKAMREAANKMSDQIKEEFRKSKTKEC